jgi:hypothetical protein
MNTDMKHAGLHTRRARSSSVACLLGGCADEHPVPPR